MATTATHSVFIKEVVKKLNKRFNEADQLILTTAAQSADPFYFYNILSQSKKNKKIRKIATKVHNTKINDLFITMIKYIKANNLEHNSSVMAYLYGLISHYILDSTIHPFVLFKTGKFKKADPSTWKYSGLHHDLEMNFDRYIIETKLQENPFKYRFYKALDNRLSPEILRLLDHSFYQVFKIKDYSRKYQKSISDMKRALWFFRYDPYGIKLFFYRLIRPFRKGKLDPLVISYSLKTNRERDYFNLAKQTWNYPTNKKIKSNKSLIELYDEALKKTVSLIKELDKYLYENKKLDLDKLFANKSYATGVDWRIDAKPQYFEF